MVLHQAAHQLMGRGGQSVLQAPLAEGGGMAQPRLMEGTLGRQGAQQQDQGADHRHRQGKPSLPAAITGVGRTTGKRKGGRGLNGREHDRRSIGAVSIPIAGHHAGHHTGREAGRIGASSFAAPPTDEPIFLP